MTSPGYEDDIHDYWGNEVALDYNAGLVGTLALCAAESATAVSSPLSAQKAERLQVSPVYPNPAAVLIHLRYVLTCEAEVEIQLSDISGRQRESREVFHRGAGEYNQIISVDEFATGVYLLSVRAGSHRETQKIVITH